MKIGKMDKALAAREKVKIGKMDKALAAREKGIGYSRRCV